MENRDRIGLVVLLALFLCAPICVKAQAPAAPPPPPTNQAGNSAPSQSGQSSSPAQAQAPAQSQRPQPQSQTDGARACSDAPPPILRRDDQPALPPCPEPQDQSRPGNDGSEYGADTRRVPSLPPDAPLIERARYSAFQYSQVLPNFICDEFMTRYAQRGRSQQVRRDVVSAEIVYNNLQESYRNVKVDGVPTGRRLEEVGGSWSTGEFNSMLLELFDPDTQTQFRSGGTDTIGGVSAQIYDFQVYRENSHWVLMADGQMVTPAYKGSIWVDPKTARVLRIEQQAQNLPLDFPEDQVEWAIDYSLVKISQGSFLLPTHSENLGCGRGTNDCMHNVIEFRNYHEFTVDVKIGGSN